MLLAFVAGNYNNNLNYQKIKFVNIVAIVVKYRGETDPPKCRVLINWIGSHKDGEGKA